MFKSWVLNSWTLSSISLVILSASGHPMFVGQVGDGMAKLENGVESVWSGNYSRYHVLRFLSFYHYDPT